AHPDAVLHGRSGPGPPPPRCSPGRLGMSFPHVDLSGAKAWRLIPTRVPSADLLARVADPADHDLLNALEAQTNRRIQAFGHANVYVAAAFAYSLGGTPSRFNDGTWGTIYV